MILSPSTVICTVLRKESKLHPLPPTPVNTLAIPCLIIVGIVIGIIIGKRFQNRKSENQPENYPLWHDFEEVLDGILKPDDKFFISYIEQTKDRKTLILKVYGPDAHANNMSFSATFYCVHSPTSKLQIEPGNYIVQEGAHDTFSLSEFKWTPQGPQQVRRDLKK